MERQITAEEYRKLPAGSAWTTGNAAAGNLRYWTFARA